MKNLNLLTTFSVLCLILLMITGCNADKQPALPAKQGQELIDSLQNALAKSGQDSNRVNALNGLSEHAGWRIHQYDTCMTYAQKALSLAQSINYKYGMGRAYNNMGNGLSYKSEYDKALKYYFKALNIFKAKNNKYWESRIYINIALTFRYRADFSNAIKYYEVAKKLTTETNDQKILAHIHSEISTVNVYQNNWIEALKNDSIAINIYIKTNNQNDLAEVYARNGGIYASQGNYPEALKYHTAALKIYDSIGKEYEMAKCYGNIGYIYCIQDNYPEALKNGLIALKIFESLGDKNGMADCYTNILAMIHISENNYSKALENSLTALRIYESIENKQGIGSCYNNIGLIYKYQGNYPEALKNLQKSLKIAEDIGTLRGISYDYNNIGEVYFKQGNISEAIKNYMTSLEIKKKTKDKYGIAYTHNNLGLAYTQLKNYTKANRHFQKALVLAKESRMKSIARTSYSGMAILDSTTNHWKGAFENYKLFTIYKDSIYNEDNTKKLTQTSMQYEFDKKQLADSLKNAEVRKLAAEKLSKQKNYTVMGAGLTVLLLGFSGFVFRNNKKLAAEKQKSESLLHNILPEEVSAELKQRGATTAKEFDAVTVLFTDFVNFTSAGERMSPKELVEELHFCFKTFDQIIDQYEIEKIKTVGDAYLAVSGLPHANAQHAQNIVKAAKEIRDFMKQRSAALGDKTFEVRIGIHSGSVVAGIVGVKKFAYDIWGDTVNTAARMEQNGEAGKINISETTHELVKDEFECTYRGEIEAKGKGKMKMYFVN